MRKRLLGAALAAALVSVLASPTTALAEDDCHITSALPRGVVIGPSGAADVQFGVSTDCDDTATLPLAWAVSLVHDGDTPSPHGEGWLNVSNFVPAPGPLTYTVSETGVITLAPGNGADGHSSLHASAAFTDDAQTYAGDWMQFSGDTYLRHSTALSKTATTHKSVKKGATVKLSAKLTFADWDAGKMAALGVPAVDLQFRPKNSSTYTTVRQVGATKGAPAAKVTVTKAGYWRFRLATSDRYASSKGTGVYVGIKKTPKLIVTPGAFCKDSQLGKIGYSKAGHKYRCSYYPKSDRNRWKRVTS